jgi:hypothetical protein
MGFILPFALTFVAIPLESFIHSARTVFGLLLVWLLHAVTFTIRLLGNVTHGLGTLLINLYDVVIFIPLKVEQAIGGGKHSAARSASLGGKSGKKSTKKEDKGIVSLVHGDTAAE